LINNDDHITLSALKITLIYVFVAALWIAFTDQFLDYLSSDIEYVSTLQTYKGWFYVLVTGIGLYWLINYHDRQLIAKEQELTSLLDELRSEKELKEILFERIPVLITIYDPDLETVEVNEEFEKVVGWSNEEIKDEEIDLLEACYPDLDTREEVVDFMNNPGVGWKEFTLTTQSGKQIPASWTNIRLTDNTSVGIGIDMTEIKASQTKVRESQKLLKKTFESLKSSLILVNPENRTIIDCNKGTEELFGYNREELIGSSTKKLHVNEEKYTEFDEMGTEALAEKGIFQTEFKMCKKDGTVFHSDHTVTLVYDEERKADKVVSVIRDITEQKNLEKRLRQSEKKYRHIFEDNPVPMWIFNPDTLKFVEVNQAAINHYGYSEEEFLNMTLADIRPPEDVEAMKKDVKQHQGKKSYSEEWTHIKKDGTKIDVELSAASVQYGNEKYRLILVNDVTKQKRLQEKIIQSILEGEDRERKRIAHELHDGLGQYLVAANMNFESVKKEIDSLPEKRRNQFSTGLSHLKNGLHETRSIAYNLMPKTIADYGLVTALENMMRDFEKSTDIVFNFEHNCEGLQLKNQAEINIYRIFQEITSNAVRHSECSTINAKLQLKEDTLTILIEDDGIGAELNNQDASKGLGLRSIKTRVNSLKGTLDIESQTGKGMTITIIIPEIDNLLTNGSS
jgi:PAS domain S-box-containing protein